MLGTNLNEARILLATLELNDTTATASYALSSLNITSSAVGQSIFAKYAAEGIHDPYVVADR